MSTDWEDVFVKKKRRKGILVRPSTALRHKRRRDFEELDLDLEFLKKKPVGPLRPPPPEKIEGRLKVKSASTRKRELQEQAIPLRNRGPAELWSVTVQVNGGFHKVKVPQESTVEMVIKNLMKLLSIDPNSESIELYCNGVRLELEWYATDILPRGTVLLGIRKKIRKPVLTITLPYGRGEHILYEPKRIHLVTGAELRIIVGYEIGIPSSVFRLMTLYKDPPLDKKVRSIDDDNKVKNEQRAKAHEEAMQRFRAMYPINRHPGVDMEAIENMQLYYKTESFQDFTQEYKREHARMRARKRPPAKKPEPPSPDYEEDSADEKNIGTLSDVKDPTQIRHIHLMAPRTRPPRTLTAQRLLGGESKPKDKGWYMKEIYDIQVAAYLGLQRGGHVWFQAWDGWVPVLQFFEPDVSQRRVPAEALGPIMEKACTTQAELQYMQRVCLYMASYRGNKEIVVYLVTERKVSPVQSVGIHPCKEWADDNYTIADLDCPVHAAAARGHVKVVQYYLLTYPDCVMLRDGCGRKMVELAEQNDHWELCNMLKQTGDYSTMQAKVDAREKRRKEHKLWKDIIRRRDQEMGTKSKPKKFQKTNLRGFTPAWVKDRPVKFDPLSMTDAVRTTLKLKLKVNEARQAIRARGKCTLRPDFLDSYGQVKHSLGRAVMGRHWHVDGLTESLQNNKEQPNGRSIASSKPKPRRKQMNFPVYSRFPSMMVTQPPSQAISKAVTPSVSRCPSIGGGVAAAMKMANAVSELQASQLPSRQFSTASSRATKTAKKTFKPHEDNDDEFPDTRRRNFYTAQRPLDKPAIRKIAKTSLDMATVMHGQKGSCLQKIDTACKIASRSIKDDSLKEMARQRDVAFRKAHPLAYLD